MKKKKTILFIEDDLPTIDVYKTALEQADFEVSPILLGQEAIRKIEEIEKGETKMPDLVLLDLILPDMNGIEILDKIRKQEKTKNLLVFILTNYTNRELKEKGFLLKSEKYLLKTDYAPSKLVELIKKELS